MKNLNDIGLLILRLVFGGFMLFGHGWGKMMKLFTGDPNQFADPFGLGAPFSLGLTAFAEVACALFIVLGLFTRWATAPLIITMLVAAFIIHGADPFGKKELAFVYLAAYTVLAFTGPGNYSLDKIVRNKN